MYVTLNYMCFKYIFTVFFKYMVQFPSLDFILSLQSILWKTRKKDIVILKDVIPSGEKKIPAEKYQP